MPNRRLAVYALLICCLLVGLGTGKRFFFNLAYVFAGLLVISLVWSWTSVNWVRITRQTRARRAQVGRTFDEYFTIRNGSLIPKIWLELRDHSDVPGHNPSTVVPFMLPFSTYRWTAHAVCAVRGEFTLGPLTLVSGDPFGFYQVIRHIAATSKVLVYPATVPIHSFATPTGLLDRLLVKEFELDPLADVWMFLDLSASAVFERPYTLESMPINEFFIPPSSVEYAIIAAASLAQYFLMKERALGFVTYNPHRTVYQPDRGNRQLTRILEALAVARPETSITCEQLLALEGHHMARGTTAVVITADPTDQWIREITLLARRGLRTIAVLLDPQSFGTMEARSADETRDILEANSVMTYTLRQGDNLTAVLSQR